MRALLVVAALLVAGCVTAPAEEAVQPSTKVPTVAQTTRVATFTFDGVASATPATPFTEDFAFEVPPGASEVRAVLEWSTPAAALRVTLTDAAGDEAARSFGESDTRAEGATVEPPGAGAWTATVTSGRALEEAFTLTLEVTEWVPGTAALNETFVVPPADFAELNLIMEMEAALAFTWEVVDGGEPLYYNIHTHDSAGTHVHDEGTFAAHEGSFTSDARQVVSFLWRNDGVTARSVTLALDGTFRVHSETHHT